LKEITPPGCARNKDPTPMRRLFPGGAALAILTVSLSPTPGDTPRSGPLAERTLLIQQRIAQEYPSLDALYKQIHSHPELSGQEVQTAARAAKELQALGFEVTTGVGGTGVVGLLKNGEGPTVLVRADMDALPVIERTGVPYASTVRTRDKAGN